MHHTFAPFINPITPFPSQTHPFHFHFLPLSLSLQLIIMVVLSQPIVDGNLAHIKTCKAAANAVAIPVVDLSESGAKTVIADACRDLGFFKVINHRISMDFLADMEAEAMKFFKLAPQEKAQFGPPNPFGYGSKVIGPNGDVGWVEYLLFSTNPDLISRNPNFAAPGISQTLWEMVSEYVSAVREMACSVLEMIAEELEMEAREALSRLISDERSDSCFRVNHYPACPELQALSGRSLIGFGEHTDPQIISVLRSNNASGLQICDADATWLSVPPDHTTFFFIVGDSLQVMTNGRFRSVKHRVLADSRKSRVSMIYFGGPPLTEKITPLAGVMEEGEESLYKEFTWCEYKKSAYKTRLGDNRLSLFEKSATAAATAAAAQ
ncbi:gibberellin 2-beta-dioxygenase-like [Salvia miltiorrhiza]|uniref:gibberellin 2beta-dioxygenase n=1 Tax=Salvia miltiorrhiza TaxID=226208 RepID=A0A0U2KTW8_SALMI|nr:gibberellin 2-beta-dioxygenase-like [Salvia miltiorrhiza]ALR74648.1 gibberellin biosynthesis-related protein GA2ox10 [Salvia miltiorrhiza]